MRREPYPGEIVTITHRAHFITQITGRKSRRRRPSAGQRLVQWLMIAAALATLWQVLSALFGG